MENGKRRADDEGILIEYNNPVKRVRHELIEFEPNGKDGAVMEIQVSSGHSLVVKTMTNSHWLPTIFKRLTNE